MTSPGRPAGNVLGARIDALSWDAAMVRLLGWARARASRYVTICNVHVVVSASRDADYREIINGSDMATPDGAPVAWMLRRQGFANQPRISGPDLMWALCQRAAAEGLPIYCYGSTEATLGLLEARLRAVFPALKMTMESPPFRALSVEEDAAVVAASMRAGRYRVRGPGLPQAGALDGRASRSRERGDDRGGGGLRLPRWDRAARAGVDARQRVGVAASSVVGAATVVEALSGDQYALHPGRGAAVAS